MLDKLWVKFLPLIEERLTMLEAAAAAGQAGPLSAKTRSAAQADAHKLAGVLGTLGLPEGTRLARELETVYSDDAELIPTEAAQRAETTRNLRAVIQSRA